MFILLVFAFLAGIVTVLSPCILPVLPAILSGSTLQGRLRPLGIVTGLVISFTFFTLLLTAIVHATGLNANVLRYIAIAIVFLFGLILLFPQLSERFANITAPIASIGTDIQGKKPRSGFGGGVILGLALGLLWTPCAGPILAAITTLVATQTVNISILLMTLFYSIGAGIPMLLIAYGGNKMIQSSRFLSAHSEGIRRGFGGLMILTAISIALHWDMILQEQIIRVIPPVLIENNLLVKEELAKLQTGGGQGEFTLFNTSPGQLPSYGVSPELTGIVNWINSPPLSLMQLKGKVVLIDFWTYSCINCLRTLPYIKQWYADYHDKGFVVIGVHTPEFEFEKIPHNVAEATARLGITYPVAQDNDYKTWLAYHNQYWPAHYLVDQKGNIRMIHFGEGKYVETENAIRSLIGLSPLTKEEPVASHRPITPETYLGTQRGTSYNSAITLKLNQTASYHYKKLDPHEVGLKGLWKVEEEKIISESSESYLDLDFLSRKVYLVLGGSSSTPLEVFLDGQPKGKIVVDGDRKYDIVDASYGWHLLSLKVPKGVSAYAFTFGDE